MRGHEGKDAYFAGYGAGPAGERFYSALGAGAEWTRRMSHSLEELSRARSGYGERYDDWEEDQPLRHASLLRDDPAPADLLRALTQFEPSLLWDVTPDRFHDITPDHPQFYPAPRARAAKEPSKGKDPLESQGAKGKRPEKGPWAEPGPKVDNEPAYWRERRLRLQGKSGMEEMEPWRRFAARGPSPQDGSSGAKESKSRGKDGKDGKGEGPKKGRLEAEAKIWGNTGLGPIHLPESAERRLTNPLPPDDLMLREHFYRPPSLSSRDAGRVRLDELIHGDSANSTATEELQYNFPARADIWGLEKAWNADTRAGHRAAPRDGI